MHPSDPQSAFLPSSAAIAKLRDQLTLERKVLLLTGRDFWTTHDLPEIGLRSMLLSDGPSGVRGEVWDERSPSLALPSATCLAATWDPAFAESYGEATAAEAIRKGVSVVLGPMINLQRSPLGGRNFESFSEDPLLTGVMAAAYVEGLQRHGVAASPKHFVANDSEAERFTVDVRVDAETLRDLYLRPFEIVVRRAHPWTLMSAYNRVNGVLATESRLLDDPLRIEWGFDGTVVSDWTAVRGIEAANVGQDLEMPGPVGAWGPKLLEAVHDGRVSAADIDAKVDRILTLAARVGALGPKRSSMAPALSQEHGMQLSRAVAADGMVLLRNESGVLPLERQTIRRIAVIGEGARRIRIQGGGSASVVPTRVIQPLDAIRQALPDAEVCFEPGSVTSDGLEPFRPERMWNSEAAALGARVSFLSAAGDELFAEDRLASDLVWVEGAAPINASRTVRFSTRYTPDSTGPLSLGFEAQTRGRVIADGAVIAEGAGQKGLDLGASFHIPPAIVGTVEAVAGVPIEVEVELCAPEEIKGATTTFSVSIGTLPAIGPADELISRAVAVAKDADAVVIVVSTTPRLESEGHDRTDMALPGGQDQLVSAVVDANRRTIVVVNAGSPVSMPWKDDAGAILLAHFGGQEIGGALADTLLGEAEPGGRLTTTWPGSGTEAPVIVPRPVAGTLEYSEGMDIGYRSWLKHGANPAFAFGYGLGYTTWQFIKAAVLGDGRTVEVQLRNTGSRPGKQVVQVYASTGRPDAADRRTLVGWAIVRAQSGVQQTIRIALDESVAPASASNDSDLAGRVLYVGYSALDVQSTLPLGAPQ